MKNILLNFSCQVIQKCRLVFLSIKPSALNDVSKEVSSGYSDGPSYDNPEDFRHKTLVSILAGISLEILYKSFRLFNFSIIRAMPNTPLIVCAGATALTLDDTKSKDSQLNYSVVKTIFATLGIVETVDESKFHAITGLSGSGPAYVYIMIEALSDAGVKQGLAR